MMAIVQGPNGTREQELADGVKKGSDLRLL